jgi:hypothetical protein
MSKASTAPAKAGETAPLGPEDRYRRGIGTQKARTLKEEGDAWFRRIKRWKRAQTDKVAANVAIEGVLALDPSTLRLEDGGLRAMRFKAIKAVGSDKVDAIWRSVLGYRNG